MTREAHLLPKFRGNDARQHAVVTEPIAGADENGAPRPNDLRDQCRTPMKRAGHAFEKSADEVARREVLRRQAGEGPAQSRLCSGAREVRRRPSAPGGTVVARAFIASYKGAWLPCSAQSSVAARRKNASRAA